MASPASIGAPAGTPAGPDHWAPASSPAASPPSSVATTAGVALLAVGLVGLAGGSAVVGVRRLRVSARS